MPTIDEQLAALAGAWEADRAPVTVAEAMQRPYVAVDAPPPPTARRPRLLLAVAAVLALVVGAGAWVLVTSDDAIGPADRSDSPWWLPTTMPPGWTLEAADSPARPASPVSFSSMASAVRAVYVFVAPVNSGQADLTDRIEVGGRAVHIKSLPNGLLSMELDAGDGWLVIRAAGVSEPELLAMAATYRPGVWPPTTFPMDLPAGFRPPSRVDEPALTELALRPDVRFVTHVTVTVDAEAELGRLVALFGPLHARRAHGQQALVGRGSEYAGMGGVTAVYARHGRLAVGVVGGDDGSYVDDAVALAIAMRPVSEAAFRSAPRDAAPRLPPGPVCTVSPAVSDPRQATVRVVTDEARSVRFHTEPVVDAAGDPVPGPPSVCVTLPPPDIGTQWAWLGPANPFSVQGNDGRWFVGVAPAAATTVLVEAPDGSRRSGEVVALPGYDGGVWAMAWSNDDHFRAVEFRDAAGQVVERIGRPPR